MWSSVPTTRPRCARSGRRVGRSRRTARDRTRGSAWTSFRSDRGAHPRSASPADGPTLSGLAVDGAHNLLNAAAAVAAAEVVGVSADAAVEALAGFAGVHRRFERRGSVRGADFYDDYGHVPTELEVTLDVARRTDHRRVLAVFQPHRYSRTQALWKELGASLVGADVIVVTDIYGAAQEPIPGVTGKLVVEGIARTGSRPSGRLPAAPERRRRVPRARGPSGRPGPDDGLRRRLDVGRRRARTDRGGVVTVTDGAVGRAEAILRAACGERVRTRFELAALTTFRIGGPGPLFLEPEGESDLVAVSEAVRQTGIRVAVLGKGSNVLIADEGSPVSCCVSAGATAGRPATGDGSPPAARCRCRRSPGGPRARTLGAGVRGGDPGLAGRRRSDERRRPRRDARRRGRVGRRVRPRCRGGAPCAAADAGFSYRRSDLPAAPSSWAPRSGCDRAIPPRSGLGWMRLATGAVERSRSRNRTAAASSRTRRRPRRPSDRGGGSQGSSARPRLDLDETRELHRRVRGRDRRRRPVPDPRGPGPRRAPIGRPSRTGGASAWGSRPRVPLSGSGRSAAVADGR